MAPGRSTIAADQKPSYHAVPFRITDPERIPAPRYYDEEFYRLEVERLWPHVWQMACRLEEIPNVGDFVEYRNLDKSVIVVRTRSGVKAFHNTCRHRGVQLVEGPGNCAGKGFICPFHGWRWNLDGENTFVFAKHIFSEALLGKPDINLVPCRLETWGGMAFINFDNEAAGLRASLGPVAERMDVRNLDQLRMEWWYGTILPTNWKLAMEAFMESYHVMRTHPQLNAVQPPPQYLTGAAAHPNARTPTAREAVEGLVSALRVVSDGMAGMVHPSEVAIAERLKDMDLPEDPEKAMEVFLTRLKDQIHTEGVALGLPVPDINKVDASHPHRTVEFFFPHFFLLPTFSAMSAYRIRPLGPESCLFELWSLAFIPDDPPSERPRAPTMLAHDSKEFPPIPQQDYSNLPRQQKGLHGRGFEYMRLSKDWEGLISNYQRLIDGYLAQEDPAKLARAQNLVNDGFDHPIADIGF
ncbi:MAG: aromatic ring-hydroxylating dioxygenase subunit alpha [Sinobacteraceae bacterium]|nr:aromatic ring-hydroxylating dioxygenase subunit alpha [Nevskiaceae bacterium]